MPIPGFTRAQAQHEAMEPPGGDACAACEDNGCTEPCTDGCCEDCVEQLWQAERDAAADRAYDDWKERRNGLY